MRYRILLTCSLLMLLITGCTKEDLSICLVRTSFKCSFELNNEGSDQFAKLVNKVDLYIFDGTGLLVKHISQAQDYLPKDYTITADLGYGTYTAVIYGTVNGNNGVAIGAKQGDLTTALLPMKQGESRISDLRLMLNSITGYTDKDLGVVLHGMSKFTVSGNPKIHNISFTRNTSVVEVNASGLEYLIPQTRSKSDVAIHIEANNKAYLYDNTLDMELGKVTYAPYWQKFFNNILVSRLSVLRIFKEYPMTLKVYKENTVIWKLNLTEEIMKSPDYSSNEDLSRQAKFDVNIKVTTSGDFNIVVNGWTTTTSGEIIG